jgi:hypothetical protein
MTFLALGGVIVAVAVVASLVGRQLVREAR